MKNLTEIAINSIATIKSFNDKTVAKKLITMGVIPGREIEVLRKAPFNGAFYIRVSDLFFAIRKEEAKFIILDSSNE